MIGILYALLVLGLLILVHEFGHFIFAKLFGVGVKTFSLGFGPKILSKKIGETEYALSVLPLGGYVAMVGEDDEAECDPEKSFRSKHVFKRILIVLAGPLFNLLLGFVFFAAVFMFYGTPVLTNHIGATTKNNPAERAGIVAGDRVVAINGAVVNSWDDITKIMSQYKGDGPITVVVERGDALLLMKMKPELVDDKNIFGEPVKRYVLGITPAPPVLEKGLEKGVIQSAKTTANVTALTALGIWKLIGGKISSDNVGGPILITQMAGEAASMGFEALLMFTGLISISLFVMNVLPIPALDGGHIWLFCLEWIRGRPLSKRTQERIQSVGVTMLIALMLFAFYNDISRFFK